MGKRVREVMTQNPRTCDADGTVIEAARLMKQEDIGLVPIVQNDELVGTLTDRDIVLRVVAEGRDPQSTKIRDIASGDLVTLDPEQDLDEALRLMARHQVRRLPVVEEDGKIVGIVAQADVAREGDEERVGETVEQISR
jgi:CBS domain-containing protein